MKNLLLLFLFISSLSIHAQQTINATIFHDGLMRDYIVYVPNSYDSNAETPLMFNFHGYTGQASAHLLGTQMRPVADTAGFILVSPQGSLFFNQTHWNVGSWTNGSTADDLGFTIAMIDTLSKQYNIDQDRVYSCGYSNGGYFSFELACQLSDRIAAIGSVGGKMSVKTFNNCNPSHPTPVITIHGTADNVVSYFGTTPVGSKTVAEVNDYWTNFNNTNSEPNVEMIPNTNTTDGSTVEYYSYTNGDDCVSVDHYKVIGGGHDWPGAWGNQDINSSSLIWNFVSQYDINGLIDCNTTAIEEPTLSTEQLAYPNPTSGLLNIKSFSNAPMNVEIYSLSGQLKMRRKASTNQTIDISDLASNVYLLKIGNKRMKLIKLD